MILSLGHNDLDQLGCQLCIHEKFSSKSEINYYNTNYKNLETLCHDIEDRINSQREDIKLLMITDISFSNNLNELQNLKRTCKENKIPVIFVDHHLYPDGFFDGLEDEGFKVHWDVEYSASMGTFNALKLENTNLKKLILIIDAYDMWRDQTGLLFEVANDLNNYFWNYGRMGTMLKFVDGNYSLPYDFKEKTQKIKNDALIYYNKLKEKNLIFSPHPDYSFGFTDDHFNFCVEQELKEKKIFLSASSYGALRVRFSKQGYPDELIYKIKDRIMEGRIAGHLWSFSTDVDTTSSSTVLEKFKRLDGIIREVLEEHRIKEL